MKKLIILYITVTLTFGCAYEKVSSNFNTRYINNMKQDILSLMLAYKDIVDIERDHKNYVYLVFKSGRKLIYDDKKIKNYQQKLHNPDLEDTMAQIYPLYPINDLMTDDYSPGRIRSYKLLYEIYGKNEKEIYKNIKQICSQGNRCLFTKKNNGYKYLNYALNEIKRTKDSKSINLISPINGTYCYRAISGTNRLSPHSFGIAIDVKKHNNDYWKWATREEGLARLRQFPQNVVTAFENNYFIWGGKWSHFDILHFEYRPELIIKSKYFYSSNRGTNTWYEGVPADDKRAIHLIKLIDEKLK